MKCDIIVKNKGTVRKLVRYFGNNNNMGNVNAEPGIDLWRQSHFFSKPLGEQLSPEHLKKMIVLIYFPMPTFFNK